MNKIVRRLKKIMGFEEIEEALEDLQSVKTPKTKAKKREVEPEPEPERTMVVKEIPVKQIRRARDDDGMIVNFLTVEEALNKLIGDGGL